MRITAATFEIVKDSNASLKFLLVKQKSADNVAKTFQLMKNIINSLVSLLHDQPLLSMKELEAVSNEPIQVQTK